MFSWGLWMYPQKYALPYSDFGTTYGFLEVILTYWFWSKLKFLNIEHSWAVFQKMALKSVKLIFNSVWIAEYSYILSKNGFEALNFWNFHSGSKPVGQNHFKESIGSPKIHCTVMQIFEDTFGSLRRANQKLLFSPINWIYWKINEKKITCKFYNHIEYKHMICHFYLFHENFWYGDSNIAE